MFKHRKKNIIVDLKKGKDIFFKYYGDRFHIGREEGQKYDDCNVPKEIELIWLSEVKKTLERNLNNSIDSKKMILLDKLTRISSISENLAVIYKILNANKLDTFTQILLCEYLVREKKKIQDFASYDKIKYEQNRHLIIEINNILRLYNQKLLSSSITIDESYKITPHMKDYDFSEENIKKRINNLL